MPTFERMAEARVELAGWMVRVGGSWGRAVGRGRCVCAGCRAAGWWATGASAAAAAAASALSTGWPHYVALAAMIFFFSYFWVATQFQPTQIADDLKKYGGYIPGVRPGKPTADFLDYTMTRLTFAGAIFLTVIAILPCKDLDASERFMVASVSRAMIDRRRASRTPTGYCRTGRGNCI